MSGQHLRYTLLSKPVLFFPLFFSLFSVLHARPGQFNPEIDEDSNGVVIPSQNSTSPTHHLSVQNNFNDRQAKQDLSPELWQEVHMDEYLRQYPGGFNLSLLAYADTAGFTNFQCGIGTQCSPSQIGSGVDVRDLYALSAAHRWNTFNNQLYEATAYSIAYISDLTPTMVGELIPEASMFWTAAAIYVGVLTAAIVGTPSIVFGFGVGRILWMILMSAMFVGSAATWVMANLEVPDPQKFTRWTEVLYQLHSFESYMQGALTEYSQKIIGSPISTEDGLYGIARNGTLFSNLEIKSQKEIQTKIDLTLKLKAISHILRIQNAFVTRGSEPCTGDGPGGSRDGPDQLSYCDDSGIMMNIVLAGEDNKEHPVFNAPLITSKYELSPLLLTESAWKCQQKFGGFEHGMVVNVTNPYNTDSDCLFDLPVCDFTDPGLKHRGDMSTVEWCRKVAGLPI